ncbi:hypothetical protein [Polyangium sp. 6x1]|uniref:hypothetical protein n=1 Tax=Polyangium sp. 6x1 TaxID=3042689 RepID=UPI00248328B8|nr:hypothetical protein [Polyangium sp. 6x1]MDI1450983.1 hypothetical protein [Polyangium sp. 6x1]
MTRLLLVGLDEPEVRDLRPLLYNSARVESCPVLPRIKLEAGELFVAPHSSPSYRPVSRVVFHGIFEDDFAVLSVLALWGGPCWPLARGMMDARQRIPCLVRALAVTRFGAMKRGYADLGACVEARGRETLVAKWGESHCGEKKELFTGKRRVEEPTLIEPFVRGEATRIHVLGGRAWQIRMAGERWPTAIHHAGAVVLAEAKADRALVEDARRIGWAFGLEMFAVDYMVEPNGTKHLLGLNHSPNVTVFPEHREAYLDFVASWINDGTMTEAYRRIAT